MKTGSELGKPTYICPPLSNTHTHTYTHTHTQTNYLIHIKGISIFHVIFLTNVVSNIVKE